MQINQHFLDLLIQRSLKTPSCRRSEVVLVTIDNHVSNLPAADSLRAKLRRHIRREHIAMLSGCLFLIFVDSGTVGIFERKPTRRRRNERRSPFQSTEARRDVESRPRRVLENQHALAGMGDLIDGGKNAGAPLLIL